MVIRGVSLAFFLILILSTSNSCEKDDHDPTKDNPYNGRTTAIFNHEKEYGTVTDIEGNVYKTIQIGDQVWMAENLRTTRYRNGDEILNLVDSLSWYQSLKGAWCTYNNTEDIDTIATYGRFYNWFAVNDERGLAPEGWHVPTMDEWYILVNYLGGDSLAAFALLEKSELHWWRANYATNESGFTALGAGFRSYPRKTLFMKSYASFWASSEFNYALGNFIFLSHDEPDVHLSSNYKTNGYSIRCVKDHVH